MKTIKSIVYLSTVFFAVQGNFLIAAISLPDVISAGPGMKHTIFFNLAPVAPKEADFNENVPEITENNYDYLKPLTPKEATFDETDNKGSTTSLDNLLEILSPVTPKEADFNEIYELNFMENLQPVTPREADFNENF
jgi:hypothetical protein